MKTALLWNTFAGDLHWWHYSAASFLKFAKGRFNYVACLVPAHQVAQFREPCESTGITLLTFPEWPGIGFNHHQVKQWEADLLFPDADVIFHLDADCVFTAPCGPENWVRDGKLICPYVPFDTILRHSGRESGWMWKSRCDDAMGGDVQWATMAGFPMAHYREVYATVRQKINAHQRAGYEAYAKRAQNRFPQGICDFETLGAVAQLHFQERYHWLNLEKETHPSIGLVAQSYSHHGLDAPHEYGPALGGRQTARQLFTKLGL